MEQAKLDEDTAVDNSRLEELIRQEITPQMQMEFFEVLKESRLFLPVDFGEDAFKGIENSKPGDEIEGPSGFGIQFLTDDKGNKAVPLFTSEKKDGRGRGTYFSNGDVYERPGRYACPKRQVFHNSYQSIY